jgi:hypothetical protein
MQLSLDIKNLSLNDKFIILEELWEDMSKNVDENRFTPQWHLDTLTQREKSIKNGSSKFSTLDDVKKRLTMFQFMRF